jgi:hypothetical protein
MSAAANWPDRRPEAMIDKHRARALQVIAEHRCSTDLTNGFCGPPALRRENPLAPPPGGAVGLDR